MSKQQQAEMMEGNTEDKDDNRTTVTLYSINMSSGITNWQKSKQRKQNSDPSSVFVYNDTMMVPLTMDRKLKGNNVIHAVSSKDGSFLWEYIANDTFWNF